MSWLRGKLKFFIDGCITSQKNVFQVSRPGSSIHYCTMFNEANEYCPHLSSTMRCTKFDKVTEPFPVYMKKFEGCYRNGS